MGGYIPDNPYEVICGRLINLSVNGNADSCPIRGPEGTVMIRIVGSHQLNFKKSFFFHYISYLTPSCSQLKVVEDGLVITIKTNNNVPGTISNCEIRIKVPRNDKSVHALDDKLVKSAKIYLPRDYRYFN